ncbi:MAG TPA: tRNA (adenosine(37)-N6)-threonylcarbamoyltransferase complex dimerization subunit type 1 TsaB [Acidimicrobiales bacterium]|nr:tRNA (adenosine(37)-N6)-threonylcarbamoyltransferase complex dimerization subunit type 1 TsaB [Acidimicrobiales bacterium]
MNLLAIETATTACAIGVRAGDVQLTRVLDESRRHTEVLSSGIAAMLDELALSPGDLDRVVVDQGPGLFTGLRVGLATAGALAHAVGCDLVGVTSLELLAHGAFADGVRGRLLAVVDARRGEVFVQRFELGEIVSAVHDTAVVTPQEVADRLITGAVAVTLVGDGAARYAELFADAPLVSFNPTRVPSMAAALDVGARRAPVDVVAPIYLRDADAVANFVTRERL